MSKKKIIILTSILVLILVVASFFTYNYFTFTQPKKIFVNEYNSSDSIFDVHKPNPDYTIEDLEKDGGKTYFLQINSTSSESNYAFVTKFDTYYGVFRINYQNRFPETPILKEYFYYRFDGNTEYNDLVKKIKENNLEQNKIEVLTKTDIQNKANESEISYNYLKSLHDEFNNANTTKNRRLEIINELIASDQPKLMIDYYKETKEKLESGNYEPLFEMDDYEETGLGQIYD